MKVKISHLITVLIFIGILLYLLEFVPKEFHFITGLAYLIGGIQVMVHRAIDS